MSVWVFNELTITGPEKELKRFAKCFNTVEEGELYPRCVHSDGRRAEPSIGGLSFDFQKLGRATPKNSERWILNRWGLKGLRCRGRFEMAAGEVRFAWVSELEPALQILVELAELFPLLTVEGGYSGYQLLTVGDVRCRAGEVRCTGGAFTHINRGCGEIACM